MQSIKKIKLIYKVITLIGTVLVILAIAFGVSAYYRFRIESRHTLMESKNAELALRLMAIEYYSNDQHLYDPLTPDGLAEGAAEEIRSLSGADGTLILGSWDAARQAARSFTYQKGKLVVIYNYEEDETSRWKICYQIREAAVPDW